MPIPNALPTTDGGQLAELSQDNIDSMTADELQTVSDNLQTQIDALQARIDTIQPVLTMKMNRITPPQQLNP